MFLNPMARRSPSPMTHSSNGRSGGSELGLFIPPFSRCHSNPLFRFTPRECAVLHDVHYDGRSVLYRLSLSEMTVPYGDPRPPFHRKQAFDLGDAGAGQAANSLTLGCDCLGVIQYLDAMLVTSEGTPYVAKNVVCIHEQDNGVGWKHTDSE